MEMEEGKIEDEAFQPMSGTKGKPPRRHRPKQEIVSKNVMELIVVIKTHQQAQPVYVGNGSRHHRKHALPGSQLDEIRRAPTRENMCGDVHRESALDRFGGSLKVGFFLGELFPFRIQAFQGIADVHHLPI